MAAKTHVAMNNTSNNGQKRHNKFNKANVKRWNNNTKPRIREDQVIKNLEAAYPTIDTTKIKKFTDLPLSEKTLIGLKENNFKSPTEIQRESLKFSLRGYDILGAAKTGSGKTLAFLIPVVERLFCLQWTRLDGLGALIITPTRELAFQIFETLRKIGTSHDFSAGLIIGGKDLKFESKRMDQCNIVIGTPGRILQHMDENPLFDCVNMKILVLDEADRCLDLGFEQSMNSIIENLPAERQTLLFSATQTKSVRDLARLSLKDPMYVSVHENSAHATPEGLRQSYVVCELNEKMATLWSFIKNHKRKKILVFLSSCKQVKFVYEILCRLRPGISLMALYGSLHQMKRMSVYESFCKKKHAVLFATDIAARGLDFPEVDWVLQLDCPEDAATYVHRAGRTARYVRGGESLLVLLPNEEEAMVENLSKQRVPIERIKVNPRKLQAPQRQMEALLARDTELKATAQRAFVSYIKSVFLMKDKKVFDVQALDTDAYARSLGLAVPPRVRFLKKHLKKQTQSGPAPVISASAESSEGEISEEEEEEEEDEKPQQKKSSNTYNFDAGLSDDDGDGVLTLKRKDHGLEAEKQESEDEEPLETPEDKASKKMVTKAALAKRIIKKKIVANKKTVFDEEGEVIRNATKEKISALAQKYEASGEAGGIDISEAQLAMKEEDRFDKQRFRDRIKAKKREAKLKQKQKLKDEKAAEEGPADEWESEDSEGPDLSWLPDPDKIYGKEGDGDKDEGSEDKSEQDEEFDESESEEEEEQPKSKRRKTTSTKSQAATAPMDTGLSLQEDEELALQFLRRGR